MRETPSRGGDRIVIAHGVRPGPDDCAAPRRSLVWKIAGAFIQFVVAYGVLMAPWPGWREAYGHVYAAAATVLFGTQSPERTVLIHHVVAAKSSRPNEWGQDIVVALGMRGGSVGSRRVEPSRTTRSSRYTGFAPAALVVALVVATPIPWRRRLRALSWAVVLASGFSAAMLGFWIHGWFYGQECISLALVSAEYIPRVRMVASLLEMSTWMGPYYVTPVLIWILASFRREDLEPLMRRLAARG